MSEQPEYDALCLGFETIGKCIQAWSEHCHIPDKVSQGETR